MILWRTASASGGNDGGLWLGRGSERGRDEGATEGKYLRCQPWRQLVSGECINSIARPLSKRGLGYIFYGNQELLSQRSH